MNLNLLKKRRLDKIQDNLKDPIDKMITVFSSNHSVTCFNNYIFDSTQTHAIYCTEENLRFIFGKKFSISCAIEYSHNSGKFKMFKAIIKRRWYILRARLLYFEIILWKNRSCSLIIYNYSYSPFHKISNLLFSPNIYKSWKR